MPPPPTSARDKGSCPVQFRGYSGGQLQVGTRANRGLGKHVLVFRLSIEMRSLFDPSVIGGSLCGANDKQESPIPLRQS